MDNKNEKKLSFFFSRYKGYARPIKPATTQLIDNVLRTVPAVMAKFTAGFLKTSDPEVIEALEGDPNCTKIDQADMKKIRQGKLQFKGNMTMGQAGGVDPKVQQRIDAAEREAAGLKEKNSQLIAAAKDTEDQTEALGEAEKEIDRVDAENVRLKKEATAGNKALGENKILVTENKNLREDVETGTEAMKKNDTLSNENVALKKQIAELQKKQL
jgi:hypothetical protein